MVSDDLQKSGFHHRTHLTYALIILFCVVLVGTVGYHIIEGWDFLDSVYMTVITIATVGYEEIGPLSHTGKIFTIAIIVIGVSSVGYALGSLTQLLVGFQIAGTFGRRKLEKKIRI